VSRFLEIFGPSDCRWLSLRLMWDLGRRRPRDNLLPATGI